jgi:hypothetical protein
MTFEEALKVAPQAYSVAVFFCENPKCLRPHVALVDKDHMPIATFVVPDPRPDGTGFFNDLKSALYRSSVERTDGDGHG